MGICSACLSRKEISEPQKASMKKQKAKMQEESLKNDEPTYTDVDHSLNTHKNNQKEFKNQTNLNVTTSKDKNTKKVVPNNGRNKEEAKRLEESLQHNISAHKRTDYFRTIHTNKQNELKNQENFPVASDNDKNNKIVIPINSNEIGFTDKPIPSRYTKELMPSGLINLGNTCYMNSIIQCLASLPNFDIQLRSLPSELARSLLNLIYDIQSNQSTQENLIKFKNIIYRELKIVISNVV